MAWKQIFVFLFLFFSFFFPTTTTTTMNKGKVYALGFDFEESGSQLCGMNGELTPVSGHHIGIGASVVCFNEESKRCVILDKLFLPLLKPFTCHKDTDCVVINTNSENATLVSLDTGEVFDVGLPVDRLCDKCTVFEQKTWSEFWSKHRDILKDLKVKELCSSSKTVQEREEAAIKDIFEFRKKWEAKAKKDGAALILASDNVTYDGYLMNHMMWKYMPDTRPIFYSAMDNKKYSGSVKDTHCMQQMLLVVVDRDWIISKDKKAFPAWIEWLSDRADRIDEKRKEKGLSPIEESERIPFWSFTRRIEYLYGYEPLDVDHDHNPANDAVTIAEEFMVLWAIGNGHLKLKGSESPEKKRKLSE